MKVLVLARTGAGRATLAAVRSLGRAGAAVTLGGFNPQGRVARSRFCRQTVRFPDPAIDPLAFSAAVEAHLGSVHYDALLPICDYATTICARHQEELRQWTHLAVPETESHSIANDKWGLREAAARVGLKTPQTYLPRTIEEVQRLAADVVYPCVVKSKRGAGAIGLSMPRTPQEMVAACSNLQREDLVYDRQPLIQEYIPGEVHDVCVLFCRGEMRAALTQRRIKMYPAQGGYGTYTETTDEPALRRQAVALMESLRWHGPADVEFKIDSRTGEPVLLEINSRFWGGLALAIGAGVDFPRLVCQLAIDGDVAPVHEYRVGWRHRWLLAANMRHVRESETAWRELWQFIRPVRNTGSDVQLSDPMPSLAALWGTIRHWNRPTELTSGPADRSRV